VRRILEHGSWHDSCTAPCVALTPPVSLDESSFVVRIDDAQVTIGCSALIRFDGRLTSGGAAELESVARRIHRAALGFRPRQISVDVRALEWASEAVVRVFVAWAMWIEHGSSGGPGYRLSFIIDPSSAWQRATFRTLQSLAPGVVELADPFESKGS
jgi:hypothetical protein